MRETAGSDYPSRSCIISRLIVDPASRGNRLGYRLCAAAYKHALERDARIAFLSCSDDLIYYFSFLGFKAYMGRTWHEQYGQVVPMKLDLLDEKYLMTIGSPLLPVLRGWKQSKQPSVDIRPL
jgi:predicted N-acetyltransferase YhbS